MDATVKNTNSFLELAAGQLTGVELKEWTLSEDPQPGDVWLTGKGASHTLKASGDTDSGFPLEDINTNGFTWRAQGGLWCNSKWNRDNLVERVSKAPVREIKDGEYWMARDGSIFFVRVKNNGEVYRVVNGNGEGLMSWTASGQYNISTPEHKFDLIKQVVVHDA
jgi:hypothetical protein